MSTQKPLKRDRTAREKWWTLERRRWGYGVALAAGGVASAAGLITDQMLVAVLALAAALLGVTSLALKHPTKD